MSKKPNTVEQKVADPENELNTVQRLFKKLSPQCSVAKRALGIPQLAPQEKQLAILSGELDETKLCISMATKGQHYIRDGQVKRRMRATLVETDALARELRDQRAQLTEVDCLNYLSRKKVLELTKLVRSENAELANVENALNRLKQFENRLELATKQFCVVNYDNSQIRLEIHRLLVERDSFNIQWNRTIDKLVKGKMYLMDIFEIAAKAFGNRDEYCRNLEALKWKGLYGLNRDISEMQAFECELNHLTKLEEFLRMKGSRRICEASEKEERKRQEEMERCREEILKHDGLLNEIFEYSDSDSLPEIIDHVKANEMRNLTMFLLMCFVKQDYILNRRLVDKVQSVISLQREWNKKQADNRNESINNLREELAETTARTQELRQAETAADAKIASTLKGIEDLFKIVKYDTAPLAPLLGRQDVISRWSVMRHLYLLECEVKSMMQMAYGEVKPPTQQVKGGRKPAAVSKVVKDPTIEILKPNRIHQLVDYQPCAFCVEDYIMSQVYETPAVVATEEYVDRMFHLEDINTKFGIYSLTIPSKRHPYRATD